MLIAYFLSNLYQLALQSDISVEQLRIMNKGGLDRRDTVKVGENLLLPTSSPRFPAQKKGELITSNLLELDMGNAPVSQTETNAMKMAGTLKSVGSQDWNTVTGDQRNNQAKAQVVAPVQLEAQDFLGKFGKVLAGIAVDDEGSLKNSDASHFPPWYNDYFFAFSQVGIHGQNSRTIGNVDSGVRGNWMLGVNSFMDHGLSRNHTQGGGASCGWITRSWRPTTTTPSLAGKTLTTIWNDRQKSLTSAHRAICPPTRNWGTGSV
ncbi:inverse autotransporter beta domain-containing protein [Yersinia enterocolitica]|uniref:inverse autotransporter beta domain-containing protein n=1 Tax=Yersinia enterocolitica TaxID=630 RepID=UPI003D004811